MAGHRRNRAEWVDEDEGFEPGPGYADEEGEAPGEWRVPEGLPLLDPRVEVTAENVGEMLQQLELASVAELRRKLMKTAKGKPREMFGTIREISSLRGALARRANVGKGGPADGAHQGVPGIDRAGLRARLEQGAGEAADGAEGAAEG